MSAFSDATSYGTTYANYDKYDPEKFLDGMKARNTQITLAQSDAGLVADLTNTLADIDSQKTKNIKQSEQYRIKQDNLADFNSALTYVFVCIMVIFLVLVMINSGLITPNIGIVLIVLAITATIIYSAVMLVYTTNKSQLKFGTFVWDYTRPSEKTSTESFMPFNHSSNKESFISMKPE